ncbi:MAG TPA: 6-phosphogluconolactonase [Ktedonobacterales bacterium]
MSSPSSARRLLVTLADSAAVAQAAADLFVTQARAAQAEGHDFRVALSGGSTPRRFHALLAASPLREQLDWARVQFFWGDERCVLPDDPESNYHMARETLLDAIPISPEQVHRMRGEDDPAQAARAYEAELRQAFGEAADAIPRFDLIYVGMGPDGHTLSLFPHTAALSVTDRLVTQNVVPQLNTTRITFTATLANQAALVAFVIVGSDKADALAEVLRGAPDPQQYPSQLIAPAGQLRYIVDQAAAAKLAQQ